MEGRWNAAFSFNRKGRYPMNFFEKEPRNLFGSSPMLRDAHYCGRTCLAKLDEELRVKLQFTTTGYADHYDAIKLAVINRTDGVVDQQLFRFSDIIGQQAVRGRDPMILSRLVDTFISKISLTMLPVPKPHNTACVLSWEEARRWQSRSSGYSSS